MKTLFKVLALIAFLATICVMTTSSYASITITPNRLVFEDGDRFANVTLINTSDKTRTYNMGWEFFRMQESGSPYKPVKQSLTEFDLSKYVVFTPRRVTLTPGSKQKIRLALRRPADVPSGEYRAHLFFKPIPEKDDNIFQDESEGSQKSRATVTINVGYSIPVIFRAGQSDATLQIGDLSLDRNENNNALEAVINVTRQGGPYGLLGHLYVYHNDAGKERLVGQISNFHIFPEINKREAVVQLTQQDISGGTLRVVVKDYRADNDTVFAERTFPLN